MGSAYILAIAAQREESLRGREGEVSITVSAWRGIVVGPNIDFRKMRGILLCSWSMANARPGLYTVLDDTHLQKCY